MFRLKLILQLFNCSNLLRIPILFQYINYSSLIITLISVFSCLMIFLYFFVFIYDVFQQNNTSELSHFKYITIIITFLSLSLPLLNCNNHISYFLLNSERLKKLSINLFSKITYFSEHLESMKLYCKLHNIVAAISLSHYVKQENFKFQEVKLLAFDLDGCLMKQQHHLAFPIILKIIHLDFRFLSMQMVAMYSSENYSNLLINNALL